MSSCPFHASSDSEDGGAAASPQTLAGPQLPEQESIALDFEGRMSYGDYLHLDAILTAQQPLSPDPNEMLFIIQHQTSELWMKLMLHELRGAMRDLAADALQPAFKKLARVSKIMEQLVHAGTCWRP